MDLTNVLNKVTDIPWIKSKTMRVSLVFDAIYVMLLAAAAAFQMLPWEWATGIGFALANFKNQLDKYLRVITKNGILPLNTNKMRLVIDEEQAAKKAIAKSMGKDVPDVAEVIVKAPAMATNTVKTITPALSQSLTIEHYFGVYIDHAEVTEIIKANAVDLVSKVNKLLDTFTKSTGKVLTINPVTGNLVSGKTKIGGGFRIQASTEGAPRSAHKVGMGVDIADADGLLDDWLTPERLEAHGLFSEAPIHTPRWSHLQTRAVPSGNRQFNI